MRRLTLRACSLAALVTFFTGCGNSSFTGGGEGLRSAAPGAGDEGDGEDDDDGTGDQGDGPTGGSGDAQGATSDSGGSTAVGTGVDAGEGDGLPPGDDGVSISTDEGRAVDICDAPRGSAKTSAELGGEDVPGNGLVGGPDQGHPLGSDFDDYALTLTGSLLVESVAGVDAKLGAPAPGTIAVAYRRGTTDCAHAFTFIYRRCPNKDSTELGRETLAIGTGSVGAATLTIPAKNVFIDIVMTVSSGTSRRYGGCTLPFPLENRLYSSRLPAFMVP